jgi:hypothetical protein
MTLAGDTCGLTASVNRATIDDSSRFELRLLSATVATWLFLDSFSNRTLYVLPGSDNGKLDDLLS